MENFIPPVDSALKDAATHLLDAVRTLAYVAKDDTAGHKVRVDASSKLIWAFDRLRESSVYQAKLDEICDEIQASRAKIQELEHDLEIERQKRFALEQRR